MVVPDDRKRELRVRGLQIRVELVERVTQPISPQINRLLTESRRDRDATPRDAVDRVLVGVVAKVKNQVEIVLEHVAVRDVVAARPVLACGEGETELRYGLVKRGRRAKVTDCTLLAAQIELIEV